MKRFQVVLLGCCILFSFFLSAQIVEEKKEVVILGGGVGALTAATYLARAGMVPIVITGPVIGGAITQSHRVENWPGETAISGHELAEKLQHQAERNGAQLCPEVVVGVDFSQRPYVILTQKSFGDKESFKRYKTDVCLIALGATPNLLHVPGEQEYWSKGVYSCAVCDGSLYRGRVVAVIGGGDSAILEAQYLAKIASKVHLVIRGKELRATEKLRMQELLSLPNLEVHYQTTVKKVKGDGEKVTHLLLETRGVNEEKKLLVDGVFLAIGSYPNTELFRSQLELDSHGYILLKKDQETSKEGVYAAGDVADRRFKQAISAAGDAAKAALQIQEAIQSRATELPKEQKVAIETAKVMEISSLAQFEKEVVVEQGVVFVDFYATYCGPCRTFAPIYEGWAKAYGSQQKFLKVNAEILPELFNKYQIRSVPTLLIFNEKKEIVYRMVGLREVAEVEQKFLHSYGKCNK